jgi:hypothetical protein
MIHLFTADRRELYGLERLWKDADEVGPAKAAKPAKPARRGTAKGAAAKRGPAKSATPKPAAPKRGSARAKPASAKREAKAVRTKRT